jgi:hypothetical protein
MVEQDFDRFTMALTGAAEVYGKPLSELAIRLYWQTLARYEIEQIEHAVQAHMISPDGGQFMPKPADLVRIIDGGGQGRAATAWDHVATAGRLVGGYESVAFDDPIIHAVLTDMGGLASLNDTLQDPRVPGSNYPFMARDFQTRYRAYLERGAPVRAPSKLIGRFDIANLPRGYPEQAPLLVGDPEKAKRLMESGGCAPTLRITDSGAARRHDTGCSD